MSARRQVYNPVRAAVRDGSSHLSTVTLRAAVVVSGEAGIEKVYYEHDDSIGTGLML